MKEIAINVSIAKTEYIKVPNDMDLESTEATFYIQDKLEKRLELMNSRDEIIDWDIDESDDE